jgi:ABC-2 type transport system ATP-binding protein
MEELPKVTAETPAIQADGLSKFYGNFAAIRDVSFTIPKGQVVAFLGENGAGKSTTMKILTGYMAPSSGSARMLGHNVAEDRLAVANRFGYLPENGPLYGDMTPRTFLQFMGQARGLSGVRLHDRIEQVISQCRLGSVVGKPISKLSKGYRQRVGFAQALLHDPEILIMDEPTAGLDPNQVREVRSLIRKLGETKTILLSTHILNEVDAVAQRVLLIHEGRIRFDGSISEFRGDSSDLDEHFARLTVIQVTTTY